MSRKQLWHVSWTRLWKLSWPSFSCSTVFIQKLLVKRIPYFLHFSLLYVVHCRSEFVSLLLPSRNVHLYSCHFEIYCRFKIDYCSESFCSLFRFQDTDKYKVRHIMKHHALIEIVLSKVFGNHISCLSFYEFSLIYGN